MASLNEKVDTIWATYDTDHNGQLDAAEAKGFFAEFIAAHPIGLTVDDFDKWFAEVDSDNDGSISKTEMIGYLAKIDK